MDEYRELAERLRKIGGTRQATLMQGIVKGVDGLTCSVEFGGITIDGIRLRASEAGNENHILIKPRVGTPVVVGSLSGDLRELVVLVADEVEEIEVHATKITLNGGQNGGLINIDSLTQKVNELVQAFNTHTHIVNTTGSATAQSGTAQAIASQASTLKSSDYEDSSIKH
mgnify:FL=1